MGLATHDSVLARLWSARVLGVALYLVQVEVNVSFGFPPFGMVGLQDSSVRDSRNRVSSAILISGSSFQRTGSRSVWHQPTCASAALPSTCRSLSARTCNRVRRVARTIADLEGVSGEHVAEGLEYSVYKDSVSHLFIKSSVFQPNTLLLA